MTDIGELLRIGRETPAYHEEDDCRECGVVTGQPCTVDCEHRGGQARDAVRARIAGVDRETFVELRGALRVVCAGQDEAPPEARWVWLALHDEAEVRGLPPSWR